MEHYPDSVKYQSSAQALLECIDAIDSRCAEKIKASDAHTMMIYHPAYTYFARDYGIEQIAIEQDGKEPTPRQLTALVERAESEGINAIFIQPQYSQDKVRAIAEACDAEVVTTDPLSSDILTEIERITDIICSYEPRDTH
jgi:zinc transport system substrate-binding protein